MKTVSSQKRIESVRLPAAPPVSNRGRAWIELDGDALRNNVEVLRELLPEGCRLMPAVKAEAYGHGAVPISRELNRLGVDAFCVASVSEGAELRRAGVRGEILVLGYTDPEDFSALATYGLSQTVVDLDYAEKISAFHAPLHVHIAVDTGMHRLGADAENVDELLQIFALPNLRIGGMFTHLCADDTEDPGDVAFTRAQIERFYAACAKLEAAGVTLPRLHLLSSYGLLNYPEAGGDFARVGIALYGVLSTGADTESCKAALCPVLSLKARVASVRVLHAGESAGYGLAFTAGRETKLATLAIGYADGLPRALSCGAGRVLINGVSAPIVGRVCMDQTLVDVTDVPDAEQGDVAVLIGTSGGETISACELADAAGTITNELLSRLGPRLARAMA